MNEEATISPGAGVDLAGVCERVAALWGWVADLDAQHLFCAGGLCTLLNWPTNAPVAFSETRTLLETSEEARCWAVVQAAIRDGQRFELEVELRVTPAHPLRRVRIVGQPAAGRPGHRMLEGTIQAIGGAGRATAEAAALDEMQTLSEALPQIVWVTRPDGWHIHYNRRWFEYTGLTWQQSIGHGWNPAFHPEDQPRAAERWRQALESGEPYEIEYRLRAADGSYRWMLGRALPLRDEKGTIVKWFGTCTDIHDFKAAQEKLREQAALLEEAREAIHVRDLAGRITYWNRGAAEAYGWKMEEAVGRNYRELLQVTDDVVRLAEEQVMRESAWQGELVTTHRRGARVTVDTRWTLLRDSAGQPKSILAIDTDVTERRQLELHFLRAQRLESIGTLAGGIAHDINNVLTPIIMSSDMLRELGPSPAAVPFIDTIRQSAERGAALVKRVLSFTRAETFKRGPLDPRQLLREVHSMMQNTFPKQISLHVDIASDTQLVLGDSTQLYQVLLNLCVNARDALADGGAITLRAFNTEVSGQSGLTRGEVSPGRYVVLEVGDNGCGMCSAVAERMFEPFFTTKEPGRGSGLGLSTVLAIVRQHRGFVTVDTTPGRGTIMRVHLPTAAIGEGNGEAHLVVHRRRGAGEVILVVDDEPSVVMIVEATLRAFGYRVVSATNGGDALQRFQEHSADIALILTDIMMPVMDGVALLTSLRNRGVRVPVIAASGVGSHEQRDALKQQGIALFLQKPYTADALLDAVDRALKPVVCRPGA